MRKPRTIPQRELRNDVTRVLREAEAGTVFTVTVRGRAVARLGPAEEPPARRVDVDGGTVRSILAGTPVDDAFADELAELRAAEAPVRGAWGSP